ncbi:helix-turn-helix transcriptional regulator [Microbacterium paludicola]|uniref:ArsR/SmtB family transcription factor n=1 Tax=Microbacterium paludicola TaxID=300019 RepID=UPI00119DBC7D|nr:metalloregulator ArsR/SmtB family transcription factor [Microbacterium paludicola]
MDVFGAIADPIRRELLRRLSNGPARVVDLAAEHDVSRPAISKHLRILDEAGLVHAEVHGRERHYVIDVEPLDAVQQLLHALAARRPPISAQHLDALDTEAHRAARDRRRGTPAPKSLELEEDSA